MTEYRITDGKTIIIETARTEDMARAAGAARLGCAESEIKLLEEKKRPLTEREARQQGYWERYADYLLRVERTTPQPQKAAAPPSGRRGSHGQKRA